MLPPYLRFKDCPKQCNRDHEYWGTCECAREENKRFHEEWILEKEDDNTNEKLNNGTR